LTESSLRRKGGIHRSNEKMKIHGDKKTFDKFDSEIERAKKKAMFRVSRYRN